MRPSLRGTKLQFLFLVWAAFPLVIRGAELLPNGNFEQPDSTDPAKPAHWDKPDGLGVQWTQAPSPDASTGHGRALRMNTTLSEQAMVAQWKRVGLTQWTIPQPGNNPIAESYGLSFYSDPIPVRPGQTYRITFDYQGVSGGAKVWVRAWGRVDGEMRRRYETIVNCRTSHSGWNTLSQEFTPTKNRSEMTEMRVMLYAYYPAGVYWFDNVRIETVGPDAPLRQGR